MRSLSFHFNKEPVGGYERSCRRFITNPAGVREPELIRELGLAQGGYGLPESAGDESESEGSAAEEEEVVQEQEVEEEEVPVPEYIEGVCSGVIKVGALWRWKDMNSGKFKSIPKKFRR